MAAKIKIRKPSWRSYYSEIDLVYAYRKVKAELYYDRTLNITNELVRFEQNLDQNLEKLLNDLKTGRYDDIFERNQIKIEYLPKTLKIDKKDDDKLSSHIFFSSPKRSFEYIKKKKLTAEFRKIARFTVEAHIVFVLWIMKVGEKFEGQLSDHSYASRLPRYRDKTHNERKGGVFKPYFYDYQKWRDMGISSVRKALNDNKEIVIATFDFTSYYHKIDPKFVLDDKFLKSDKIKLTAKDKAFTKNTIEYLCSWSSDEVNSLPIGCYMSNILANVFLADFDKQILEGLNPIYYGRYMDDIFLAVENHGQINTVDDFQSYLAKNVSYFPEVNEYEEIIRLKRESWFGSSELELNPKKQKLFLLDGKTGIDLLDNIVSTISELSSERRLLPDPHQLTKSAAADVLSASSAGDEEVDSLRKADSLSIKRLSWSLLIRSNKLIADTLEPDEWKKQRKTFFEFVYQHIIRPEGILDNSIQIPRLVTILTQVKDWKELQTLFKKINSCLKEISELSNIDDLIINSGKKTELHEKNDIWASFKFSYRSKLIESTLRSISLPEMNEADYKILSGILNDAFDEVSFFNANTLKNEAIRVYKIDYGLKTVNQLGYFKNRKMTKKLTSHAYFNKAPFSREFFSFFRMVGTTQISNQDEFTDQVKLTTTEFYNALIYPVRRIPVNEVFRVFAESESKKDLTFNHFRKVLAALRGIWIPLDDDRDELPLIKIEHNDQYMNSFKMFNVGSSTDNENKSFVYTGLTHLKTENSEWASTAADKSRLTVDRYRRIMNVVNSAIKSSPKPQYLLFHELAIPDKMMYPIISRLQPEGINVILGKEYTHIGNKKIYSTAEVFLIDNRIAPGQYLQITQQKGLPAPGEDEALIRKFDKHWAECNDLKAVFHHNGFRFGVLICSELQSMIFRKHFQGKVDSLFILSWNQDLETFNALVEASSLDIHAHIALVNNRKFGDTRVRTPFKVDYLRDVFRIKGGENDSLGVVKMDFASLRRFQSKNKRWPKEDELYKPLPEDYNIDISRRSIPNDN